MSEERTSPMRVPKGKRGAQQDDQQTTASDQDPGLAPTINMPPGQGAPGFVRATPYDTPTPPPQRPAPPYGPPAPAGPFGAPPPAGPFGTPPPAGPFGTPPPATPFGPGAPQAPAGGGRQGPGVAPASDHTQIISARTPPVFAWLVVVDGPDRGSIGKVHSLAPDTTTVGRAPGNTIVLGDQTCSSQHFRIRMEAAEGEDPSFVLYDMGSRNGTFVGAKDSYRKPESQAYRQKLQDGDYLLVGETTLVFKRL